MNKWLVIVVMCLVLISFTWGSQAGRVLGNVTSEIVRDDIRPNYRTSVVLTSNEGLKKPSGREDMIANKFYEELWKDPDIDEEIVKKRVARSFGIPEKELDRIFLKVMLWYDAHNQLFRIDR